MASDHKKRDFIGNASKKLEGVVVHASDNFSSVCVCRTPADLRPTDVCILSPGSTS